MLSAKAKIAAVLGWPVSHSLSPRLHNYWLNHYGIDGAYIACPVMPDDLEHAIRALPKMGFRGCNLTIPHKEAILPLMDSLDEDAQAIGAVNTIVIGQDGALHGMNTDAHGFIRNIRPHLGAHKNKAVVLGAGGAAKAICHALIKEGFGDIVVVNRNQEKAHAMSDHFSGRLLIKSWEGREQILGDCDLLINATSLGMEGKELLSMKFADLPLSAVVTDIVYTPLMTPLLQQAKARGNPVVDGLGMLIHQAVPGFKAWFGVNPEVTPELRSHLIAAT